MKTLILALVVVLGSAVSAMPASAAKAPSKAAQFAQARVDAAAKAYAAAEAALQSGRGSADAVYTWSVRWLEAQREQPLKGKPLKAAIDEHLARMVSLESTIAGQVTAGTATQTDALAAAYYRAEAEFWSARGK